MKFITQDEIVIQYDQSDSDALILRSWWKVICHTATNKKRMLIIQKKNYPLKFLFAQQHSSTYWLSHYGDTGTSGAWDHSMTSNIRNCPRNSVSRFFFKFIKDGQCFRQKNISNDLFFAAEGWARLWDFFPANIR